MGAIDINTLTIEQYIALTRRDRPGVVILELGNDVDFEIKSHFMSELKCNLFACTDDEDAHEHVRRVLEFTDLFYIPGVTDDALMLRVFPITLTRAARRWKNLLLAMLKGNIHDIHVGCKIYEEVHLTEERPFKEDRKVGEHVKYIILLEETINRFMEELTKKQSALDERIRKFRDDTEMSFRMLDATTKNLQGKSEQLTQEILTSSMDDEAKTKLRNKIKVKKEWEQKDEAQDCRTLKILKKLKINRSLIRAIKRMPKYLMYVNDMFSSKKSIVEKDAVRLNDRCTTILENQPPLKENDLGSFTLPCLIGISESLKYSIKMGKKKGEITPPRRFQRQEDGVRDLLDVFYVVKWC
uniref:Reverse transcriptase domain-containing protein n=1 Tax=Tanacetum cinerariifolium TaxID=118510 RepID=A0A6L2KL58_TANCI|nr:hypothetical protein [Tanacetum cinerariifolium]